MQTQNYIDAIGHYYGEPQIEVLLTHVGAVKQPKIKRGERSANVVNETLGIELAFTHADMLDVVNPSKYPDGAIVLSSVHFYADAYGAFKKYHGELPHGIQTNMGLKDVIKLLGEPSFANEYIGVYRWDRGQHCVFVDCEVGQKITQVGVQLPVG